MLSATEEYCTDLVRPILHEVDPDQNFFNEVFTGNEASNESNYFTINEYNSTFNNTSTYINIVAFNVRSWNRNDENCASMLKSLNNLPQIIVLTETWLTSAEQDLYLLEGYNEYHTVRHWGRSGGVSVLCRDSISSRIIPSLTLCNETIETSVLGWSEFELFSLIL